MLDVEHLYDWQQRHRDILLRLVAYSSHPYEEYVSMLYRGYNERCVGWVTHNIDDLLQLYDNCFWQLNYSLPKFLALAYRSSLHESIMSYRTYTK